MAAAVWWLAAAWEALGGELDAAVCDVDLGHRDHVRSPDAWSDLLVVQAALLQLRHLELELLDALESGVEAVRQVLGNVARVADAFSQRLLVALVGGGLWHLPWDRSVVARHALLSKGGNDARAVAVVRVMVSAAIAAEPCRLAHLRVQ